MPGLTPALLKRASTSSVTLYQLSQRGSLKCRFRAIPAVLQTLGQPHFFVVNLNHYELNLLIQFAKVIRNIDQTPNWEFLLQNSKYTWHYQISNSKCSWRAFWLGLKTLGEEPCEVQHAIIWHQSSFYGTIF